MMLAHLHCSVKHLRSITCSNDNGAVTMTEALTHGFWLHTMVPARYSDILRGVGTGCAGCCMHVLSITVQGLQDSAETAQSNVHILQEYICSWPSA